MFITKEKEQELKKGLFEQLEMSECLDDGMLEYLQRINAISGIVTAWSCSGHSHIKLVEEGESNTFTMNTTRGYLLFYITENMFDLLTKEVYPILQKRANDYTANCGCKTGLEFEISYVNDYIRLQISWFSENYNEFMDFFIKQLEKYC